MHHQFARLTCSVGLALLAGHAGAQDTARVPGVDESKIPDWVKRQAASPQKFIINSTAVRPKAETIKPEAALAHPVHQASRRPAAPTTEPAVADPGPRGNAQVVSPVAAASAATSAASAPAFAGELTELPPPAEPMPAPPVAEAPSAAPPTLTQPAPTELAVPAPTQPEPVPATALVLLTKVDPVLTPDLIDGRLTDASVTVGFTVGTQGEIINPQITASTDRRLNRSVLRAVAEWRYAPPSEPRPHSVKFTFAVTP